MGSTESVKGNWYSIPCTIVSYNCLSVILEKLKAGKVSTQSPSAVMFDTNTKKYVLQVDQYASQPMPKSFACEYLGGRNVALNASYWTPGSKKYLPRSFDNSWASLNAPTANRVSSNIRGPTPSKTWLLVDLQGSFAVKHITLAATNQRDIKDFEGTYLLVGNSLPEVMDPLPTVEAFLNNGYLLCYKINWIFMSITESHNVFGVTCKKCYLVGKYLLLYKNQGSIKMSGISVIGIPA